MHFIETTRSTAQQMPSAGRLAAILAFLKFKKVIKISNYKIRNTLLFYLSDLILLLIIIMFY